MKRIERPEKTIKLVLFSPKSIKIKGEELFSFFTKARATASDSASRIKGIKPAFLKIIYLLF